MKHMWVLFLCLTIIIKLAYSQNYECVHERKWQIGHTMYENYWRNRILWVHASCSNSSYILPFHELNWNMCKHGRIRRLPRCQPKNEVFFKCKVGKKWQDGFTKYEVISYGSKLYVVAACTTEGFVIERNASSIRCNNSISNRVLPQCRKGEVKNIFDACATGRRSRSDDYEFENVWHHGALYVRVFCTHEGIENRSETILCENGKMKRTPMNDFCKIQENDDKACILGKKWTANDTEYEIKAIGKIFMVFGKCVVPGFLIAPFSRRLCEGGRIPEVLPQCKAVDFLTSTISRENQAVHTANGNISDATDESIGSSDRNKCRVENGGCSQICYYENRKVQCSCHKGYQLQSDNKTCSEKSHEDACFSGRKWTANFTEYEIFTYGIGFLITSKCKNPSVFRITGKSWKLCEQGRIPSELPQCKEKSHEDECFSGKKWTLNNTEYEIFTYGNGFMVTIKCRKTSVFRITGKSWKLCEQGRIPSELPQCKAVNLPPRATSRVTNNCRLSKGGCNNTCNNLNGTVQCSCNEGYELHWDNKTCIDINECLSQNFGCSDKCLNTLGSAFCSCPDGFTLQSDRKQCTDIDECANNTINKCHHQCINTKGSYKCSCHPGYVLINDFKCEDKNLLDACATGRSSNDDYEFEYVWHHGTPHVRVFCIHEGTETESETIPCENGKIKRTPPIDFCYEPFFW